MKSKLFSIVLLAVMLLSACAPATSVPQATEAPATLEPTLAPAPTEVPAPTEQAPAESEPEVKLIGAEMPLDIVGVTVIPHTYSGALRQGMDADSVNGALIQVYLKNRNTESQDVEEAALVPAEAYFNGNLPLGLLNTGQWLWSDTPDRRPDWWESRMIPAGNLEVYTLNVRDPQFWGGGESGTFSLYLADWMIGYEEEYIVPVAKPDLYVSRIVFTSSDNTFTPDGLDVFVKNDTAEAWTVSGLNVWTPSESALGATHAWQPGISASEVKPFGTGAIAAGELGGAQATLSALPLAQVIVEVQVTNGTETRSLFNQVRAFVNTFDIGAGWINGSETGAEPMASEAFLKTLKLFHLNTAHIAEVAGYSDTELYNQYPLKMFWPLNDPKYSTDEWLPRVHGNEQLGEPECAICPMPKTPQMVSDAFQKFRNDRFPMTITHSDETVFRYYAGLGDFPHFDAYRVVAPSVDDWTKYSDRWGGQTIGWGAPLETIGDMMRTLDQNNYPKPIAVWSQGLSSGWTDEYDGRTRKAPNALEVRIQNYEALANGASSVYWFNMEHKAQVCFRDTLDEFRLEGREMALFGELLAHGAPYNWQRREADMDLSVIAGSDYAVLFAIDLTYKPDMDKKVFVSGGTRNINETFTVPAYLGDALLVFKVDANGVHEVGAGISGSVVTIEDTIDTTGVYIVTTNPDLQAQMTAKYDELVSAENALGFDPVANDADFEALVKAGGYESADAVDCSEINP